MMRALKGKKSRVWHIGDTKFAICGSPVMPNNCEFMNVDLLLQEDHTGRDLCEMCYKTYFWEDKYVVHPQSGEIG